MSILLADMSSGLQLAAGLNLASAVLMQTHRQSMGRYTEYISYVRDVIIPNVRNEEARDRLANAILKLEQVLFNARFKPYPVLGRLSALCLASGAISTICLFMPAFHQLSILPFWSAFTLAVGCFLPFALSLRYVYQLRRSNDRRLEPLQEQLQQEITRALSAT